MKNLSPAAALLTLAALLAPIMGGQLPNDVGVLTPGFGPTLSSLGRGMEVATLQHALLGLFVVAAFAFVVVRRKILQVPQVVISAPLAAFLCLLIASVFMSAHRWVSQVALAEWLAYGIATVACVAGLGRKSGPKAMLAALSTGTGMVALLGLSEYGTMKAQDPTWRIFSTWNNPNALAGILVIGILVSLALMPVASSLLGRILAGASASLSVVALLLTGSKGGILVLVTGLIVLLLTTAGFVASERPRPFWHAPALIFLAVLAQGGIAFYFLKGGFPATAVTAVSLLGLAVLAALRAKGGTIVQWAVAIAIGGLLIGVLAVGSQGKGVGSRVSAQGSTREQSSGFRLQLWKGAVALVKENPVGEGLGTYPFHSARPGTNTRTELAHSTWLQLAVEAGILAPFALLAMVVGWLIHTARNARFLPFEQNALRSGVIAAVLATSAHGFLESNLYFFGIGLSFFLLIGAGIQLSADGGAPEFVAPPIRGTAIVVGLLCAGQLLFAGWIGKLQSNLRWLAANGQMDEAQQAAEELRSIAPFDAETWFRSGYLAGDAETALRFFLRAAEVAPSAKTFRRVAQVQEVLNQHAAAESTLKRALALDPNNLPALSQMLEVQDKSGNRDAARATARRMLEVEATPYFRIRSLPEIIPTETYEARLNLAKDDPDRVSLLREATEGLLQYAKTTLPYARQMAGAIGGLTTTEAERKTQLGLSAAEELKEAYKVTGDSEGVRWADGAIAQFEAALRGT